MIVDFNGISGDPHSFDHLETLLAEQAYRLCYWRVASDEINYRRFFDINALAAIRVEDPEVFRSVHAMVFKFIKQGWVTALRVDHPDGLLDPQQYFTDLQRLSSEAIRAAARSCPSKAIRRKSTWPWKRSLATTNNYHPTGRFAERRATIS